MNKRKAKKIFQCGTLVRIEGTTIVAMSLGYRSEGKIDTFNLIDIVKGVAVKQCSGRCRLATHRERAWYWMALMHILNK